MFIIIMSEQTTEQHMLEMGNHLKEMIEEKNELIKELKKGLMVLYGLIRVSDENQDHEMIIQARQVASEFIDKFLFNED